MLASRQMRPVPHFYDFIVTLNYFIEFKNDKSYIDNWLQGLSEIAFNKRLNQ